RALVGRELGVGAEEGVGDKRGQAVERFLELRDGGLLLATTPEPEGELVAPGRVPRFETERATQGALALDAGPEHIRQQLVRVAARRRAVDGREGERASARRVPGLGEGAVGSGERVVG